MHAAYPATTLEPTPSQPSSVQFVNEVTGTEHSVGTGAEGPSSTVHGGTGGVGGGNPPPGDRFWNGGLNGNRQPANLLRGIRFVIQVIQLLWRDLIAFFWQVVNEPFFVLRFLWEFMEEYVEMRSSWAPPVLFQSFVFVRTNNHPRDEVRQGPDRCLWALIKIGVQVAVVLSLSYLFSRNLELANALILLPTRGDYRFWEGVLNNVIFVDLVAKLGTVLVKCLVAGLPDSLLKFSKRAEVFNLIEFSSQLYRSLLPVRPWLTHFTSAYQHEGSSITQRYFGLLYSAIYVLCKLRYDTRKRLGNWWTAFNIIWIGPQVASKQAGSDAIAGLSEDICPICQEDDFVKPTKLQCGHVFCDKCITTWFNQLRDRGQVERCPLCRAKVGIDDKLRHRDGSTLRFTIFA